MFNETKNKAWEFLKDFNPDTIKYKYCGDDVVLYDSKSGHDLATVDIAIRGGKVVWQITEII